MNTMTFQSHSLASEVLPRGARIAADLFGRLLKLLSFEASPAASASRADEAEYVRTLARRAEATDPGFAADLYAAAARHEALGD